MDIFEFALEMEQEGIDLYLKIAGGSDDEGIKKIFTMLASDEKTHQEVIRNMRSGNPGVKETEVLSKARDVFAGIKDDGAEVDVSQPQADLYRLAGGIEEESVKFYLGKAAEEQDPGRKAIFKALAEEEKKHLFLLEQIIEFVSRPETWLEDAEFNHLEEY